MLTKFNIGLVILSKFILMGKKKAFPGSDLDNAYIIINGANNKIDDEQIINKFKGGIWNNTDQRIVSYNEHAAFPSIYSKRQIKGLLDKINQKTNDMHLHSHKEEPLYSFDIFELGPKKVYPNLFEYYSSLKKNYTEDYVKANEFFIDLCKKFTMYNDTKIDKLEIEELI